MADTMGTQEASEKWGYPQSTISGWCRKGLIKDASQDKKGSPWHIPKDAECLKPIKKKECEKNNCIAYDTCAVPVFVCVQLRVRDGRRSG